MAGMSTTFHALNIVCTPAGSTFLFFSPESWKIARRRRDKDTQRVLNRRFGVNGNGSVFQSPLTEN